MNLLPRIPVWFDLRGFGNGSARGFYPIPIPIVQTPHLRAPWEIFIILTTVVFSIAQEAAALPASVFHVVIRHTTRLLLLPLPPCIPYHQTDEPDHDIRQIVHRTFINTNHPFESPGFSINLPRYDCQSPCPIPFPTSSSKY